MLAGLTVLALGFTIFVCGLKHGAGSQQAAGMVVALIGVIVLSVHWAKKTGRPRSFKR